MILVGRHLASTARCLHTSRVIQAGSGFFVRPANAPTSSNSPSVPQSKPLRPVAQPHTPAHIPAEQAPNFPTTWSESQNPRQNAMKGPRFEQIDVEFQPQPLAAIEMIQREPIRLSSKRIAACDGGKCFAGLTRRLQPTFGASSRTL